MNYLNSLQRALESSHDTKEKEILKRLIRKAPKKG